jgi:hypothetical protein
MASFLSKSRTARLKNIKTARQYRKSGWRVVTMGLRWSYDGASKEFDGFSLFSYPRGCPTRPLYCT